MTEAAQAESQYPAAEASAAEVAPSMVEEGNNTYAYGGDPQEYSAVSSTSNRMEHSEPRDSVEYALSEAAGQQLYEGNVAGYAGSDGTAHHGSYSDQGWPATGYMSMSQEGLHYNGDVGHDPHMGYGAQSFDMTGGMVGAYAGMVGDGSMQSGEGARLHPKMLDMSQADMLQSHSMSMKMDQGSMSGEAPRRVMSKGRKNKDEANELVRRAKLLPKVMGVRYDANHQYWVATWYQNRKRMDRYFSVGRFGFEEARMLAIDCRKTAGKSLQGKSYDRPQYSSKDVAVKSRSSYDGDSGAEKGTEYYGGSEASKKTKDFNRLNVSKVALNYILSDLCNNCLPSILENNHMPGELYIHCYNKISDHLQMIITANQSEEIEKYLHLFQLCIQNRVLPSALQVQEQRAMITTLCQM